MFSSLVLTLTELGMVVHAGHVLDGVSYEESTSAQADLPLTKANFKSKIEKRACIIRWSWGWQGLEVVAFIRNKISFQYFLFRGGMVQTSEQYEFVHHALSLYESRLSAEAVQ